MPFENVTPEFVNAITSNRFASQTADEASFNILKNLYDVYVNQDINFVPQDKQDMMLGLLIAHHYATNTDIIAPDIGGGDLGGKGGIASESIGDVSVSYVTTTATPVNSSLNWLQGSTYGQQFIMLMKTFKSSPIVL